MFEAVQVSVVVLAGCNGLVKALKAGWEGRQPFQPESESVGADPVRFCLLATNPSSRVPQLSPIS